MNTVHLTDDELQMARHAAHAYLQAFGHEERETLDSIRRVIAKLDAALAEDDDPHVNA
jgi:hypothetical protein